MGVDADSAVGLLGLLLFINLLRVGVQSFTTSLKADLCQDIKRVSSFSRNISLKELLVMR